MDYRFRFTQVASTLSIIARGVLVGFSTYIKQKQLPRYSHFLIVWYRPYKCIIDM